MCQRQVITVPARPWRTDMNYSPAALLGDPSWGNYQVSTDVLLEETGSSAELLGRIDRVNHDRSAYHLRIDDGGFWRLSSEDCSGTDSCPGAGAGTWRNVSLAMQGQSITAFVDHVQVASLTHAGHAIGRSGLAVGGFQQADFTHFGVSPLAGPASTPVTNTSSLKCLDVSGSSTADGALVVQWTCTTGRTSRQWTTTQ